MIKQWPECMEQIGPDAFRCSKFGFKFRTTVLPIHCNCAYAPDAPPPRMPIEEYIAEHKEIKRTWREANFWDALVARWKPFPEPKRSMEEIQAIVAEQGIPDGCVDRLQGFISHLICPPVR